MFQIIATSFNFLRVGVISSFKIYDINKLFYNKGGYQLQVQNKPTLNRIRKSCWSKQIPYHLNFFQFCFLLHNSFLSREFFAFVHASTSCFLNHGKNLMAINQIHQDKKIAQYGIQCYLRWFHVQHFSDSPLIENK